MHKLFVIKKLKNVCISDYDKKELNIYKLKILAHKYSTSI